MTHSEPLFYFDFRWSYCEDHGSLEEFKVSYKRMQEMFRVLAKGKVQYIFQLECTPRPVELKKPDNWHFQGFLHLPERADSYTLACAMGSVCPGISVRPCSTAGLEALKKYCMKRDDSYRAGPWADKELKPEYHGDDLPKEWRPFQKFIIDRLSAECKDDRKICWLYDKNGNTGKSKVVKYLVWKKLAAFLTFDTAANLLYQVVQMGACKAYVFDLPRTKSQYTSIDEVFNALEAIKNGMVQSGKFQGGQLMMPSPHVWVFSNYLPDLSKLSPDRYSVYTLTADYSIVEV